MSPSLGRRLLGGRWRLGEEAHHWLEDGGHEQGAARAEKIAVIIDGIAPLRDSAALRVAQPKGGIDDIDQIALLEIGGYGAEGPVALQIGSQIRLERDGGAGEMRLGERAGLGERGARHILHDINMDPERAQLLYVDVERK